jgi:hypothetical protein
MRRGIRAAEAQRRRGMTRGTEVLSKWSRPGYYIIIRLRGFKFSTDAEVVSTGEDARDTGALL